MSKITCLKELNEKGCLEYKDEVIFTVKEKIIEYKINGSFLNNLRKLNNNLNNILLNDEIFEILRINKDQISEKAYGYKSISHGNTKGYWPETTTEDLPALTRLVKELCTIIEEGKPKYTKFNRFEIMDM